MICFNYNPTSDIMARPKFFFAHSDATNKSLITAFTPDANSASNSPREHVESIRQKLKRVRKQNFRLAAHSVSSRLLQLGGLQDDSTSTDNFQCFISRFWFSIFFGTIKSGFGIRENSLDFGTSGGHLWLNSPLPS